MNKNISNLKAPETKLNDLQKKNRKYDDICIRNIDVEQLMKNVNAEKALRIIRDVFFLSSPSYKYRYGDYILNLFHNYFNNNNEDWFDLSKQIVADENFEKVDWFEFKKSPYFKGAIEVCEKVYNKIFSEFKPTEEIAVEVIYYNTNCKGLEYVNKARTYGI